MPDGLGPTKTLTAFERYDKGGDDNEDDADGGNDKAGDDDLCNRFQISSKLERAEKGGRSCNALGKWQSL